ncbi:NAD(P)H-dependent glycerol-3-phosphate dehydrogenase [Roseateles sp. BYS180W]|uniref:Glycerol-3-phosphate dehydrogenase [NAD(P)+] n=1 Tax=Roseateles rivi TaxID=3299028 RepID=A0ABW7FRI1_9BURK
MKISILGAGAWGTALALAAARRHDTLLWARSAEAVARMQAQRSNAQYLPGVAFPPDLALSADFHAAVAHAREGVLVVATPMSGLRETLAALQQLQVQAPVLWLCKGFEAGTARLGHEIAREVAPSLRCGVLSGPSFAQEVAAGQPTALVSASADPTVARSGVEAFHGERLRVYSSADPVGVEVGGAVKNVMAIAVGIGDGLSLQAQEQGLLGPGLNARAALITRGLAEMQRLALALGAQTETLLGLAGLGDLVLTATGDLSRNRRVGLMLAQGLSVQDILQRLGHVAEGVYSAPTVLARAQQLGVDMPITEAVVDVLQGRIPVAQTLERLMGRQARSEW